MENRKAKICVPVWVRRAAELRDTVSRASEAGDFVEIRFDCFPEDQLEAALRAYADLRRTVACPVVVTFRPNDEGGGRTISFDERLRFWSRCAELWKSNAKPWRDFADVEFTMLSHADWNNQIAAERTVCSHHDFEAIPDGLNELYDAMAKTPAAVLKIAVQADDAVDCLATFNLLERAQRDGRQLIAVAMGPAGIMTRILGPSRGSFLTYGSLDDDSATAPGQLTARELREVYRIDVINRQTEVLGVIGKPVTHSISPHIHNAVLAQGNVDAVFIPIEVGDLDSFMRRMVRESSREIDWNLRGLSVTAPHKTAVMRHLDWIEPAAKGIGAVNTIVARDGQLYGYNTDAVGFITPLKSRMGSLKRVRCAVIGAGGAARAVVWALREEQADTTIFARKAERAGQLKDDFGVDWRPIDDATFNEFDVVVHATPIGTRSKSETETLARANQLRGVRLAYDLVYNPLETQFAREARKVGCETIGGLEMLIGQAVEQSKLWTGKEPDVDTMRRAAINGLK